MHGREETFPAAVLQEINGRNASPGAEYVCVGGLFPSQQASYRVIIDRISHRVPFYRTFLRHQVRLGALALPEIEAVQALDRLVVAQIAQELDIPALETVALPTRDHPARVIGEDLRNLVYPLPWDNILERIGFPAVVRPLRLEEGSFFQLDCLRQLWEVYAATGSRQVVLQSTVPTEERLMALVIGEECLLLGYSPSDASAEASPIRRSALEIPEGSGKYENLIVSTQACQEQVKDWSRALAKRSGLSSVGVEWVICKGRPNLVDLHFCPNLDWWVLGETHFAWAVRAIADVAIEWATRDTPPTKKSPASASGKPDSRRTGR